MSEITGKLSAALDDRYRIIEHLGEGGMANVYLAEDLKHQRRVAVKVLRPELAAVLGAERFVQEITTTANLQHPHILPLFDSGEADGFLYYVMPYIDGETLREKLNRETQLGIDEAVKITTEVADALDYAHRHNVIHRDIKPENILLHDGRPMVADFGIALAVSAAAGGRMTETGLSLGTPHYMSPEQATAEKDLTNRSDIYSLGTVLYEMLTGDPPHTGSSAQQIIMKIVTDEARPVTELRRSVPNNVAAAVAQALEKLPADRFATASQFAASLADANFSFPVGRATGGSRTTAGWKERVALPLAAVAVAVAVVAWAGWTRQPDTTSAPLTRLPVALPQGQHLRYHVLGYHMAISRDGSRLVYNGEGGSAGQLWIRERDQLEGRPLPDSDGGLGPTFSPDGEHVVFATGQPWQLRRVDVDGSATTLLDSFNWYFGSIWGDDGYIYLGNNRGIYRIPENGGEPEYLTSVDSAGGELGHGPSAILPNGRGAIIGIIPPTFDPSDVKLAVADFATGEHRELMGGASRSVYLESGHLVALGLDGTISVAAFDAEALELAGPWQPLERGVSTFAVSESGTLVYVPIQAGPLIEATEMPGSPGTQGTRAFLVDRTGNAVTADSSSPFGSHPEGGVVVSPDGARVAVNTDLGAVIRVKNLPTGPITPITFEGTFNAAVAWSPDSRSILYVSDRGGDRGLWLRRADGVGDVTRVAEHPDGIVHATWHMGTGWVVFATGAGATQHDLHRIRIGGDSLAEPLRATAADEYLPAISPDGAYLAYTSNETGRNEVYLHTFPDIDGARWRVSVEGGAEPRWVPDGTELLFRDFQGAVMRVGIEPGQTPPMTAPSVLIASSPNPLDNYYSTSLTNTAVPQYDILPDGESLLLLRFAASSRTSQSVDRLVWVDGWMNTFPDPPR